MSGAPCVREARLSPPVVAGNGTAVAASREPVPGARRIEPSRRARVRGRNSVGPMVVSMSCSATKIERTAAARLHGTSGWMGCRGAPPSATSAPSSKS